MPKFEVLPPSLTEPGFVVLDWIANSASHRAEHGLSRGLEFGSGLVWHEWARQLGEREGLFLREVNRGA